jgi:amino acid transporter/Trk K+ transport system NAD-binding subunit
MMPILSKSRRLRKELSLLDVYAIATGTTLSAGFFLLPGLAAAEAGPALVLSYLIAAVPMVPAMFCAVELATAMPRAGGAYYFLDRSLGPLAGTIGGMGTWLALILKTTFALIGMGAYLGLFFPNAPMVLLAVAFALFFGVVNVLGARKSGRAQLALVTALLVILAWMIGHGWTQVDPVRFEGFLDAGWDSIFSTAGLVYISYVGITNVASVSEEVKDPEKNLPRGVFLALTTAVIIYGTGTFVIVGIVPREELAGALTPVALAADRLAGPWGIVLVSAAAMLAFSSVANAGILSSSRYPLAMSRDHLLPGIFSTLGRGGSPTVATALSVAAIIAFLCFLDPAQVAKLASAFQLLVFAGLALAVIVMRESHIDSYDPGYRAPAYPWLPLLGIAAPVWLIAEMGWMPILLTGGVIATGSVWYFRYARHRVIRDGAVYHVFERLGRRRFEGLDRELRSILKEKGLRDQDPFDEIVARAAVLDLPRGSSYEEIVERAAAFLSERISYPAQALAEGFLSGTRTGATPVAGGIALPHLRLRTDAPPEIVLVRARQGVRLSIGDVFGETESSVRVYAVFFLISPEHDPGQHLRILAHLAEQVDQDDFLPAWMKAEDDSELIEVLLHNERYLSLHVRPGTRAGEWSGRALRELSFPEGCLVALIRREGQTIVPSGKTILQDDDRLTVIGSVERIRQLRAEHET